MAIHILTRNGTIQVVEDSMANWQKPYRDLVIKGAEVDSETGTITIPLTEKDADVLRTLL